MVIKNILIGIFLLIALFLVLLILDSVLFSLNIFVNEEEDESIYVYKMFRSHKIDMFILLAISLNKYLFETISFKTYLLLISTYLVLITLLRIIKVGKLKLKIDKTSHKIEVENISSESQNVFNLELKLIKDEYKALIPSFSLELLSFSKNTVSSYLNNYYCKNGKFPTIIKEIIYCENVSYIVNSKVFEQIDDAFVELIRQFDKDKSFILSKKNEIKELYENLNPDGKFENLNLFFNY